MPAINITSYATLQTAIAAWLNRSDLTAEITGLIQLAEAKINRKVRRKTLRANLTISGYVTDMTTLASFGELRSLHLVTTSASQDAPIDIGSPEQLASFRQMVTTAGRPVRGAVVGTDLLLGPTPDQSYTAEATYFEKLQPLSVTNVTNSILLSDPDLYLWGSLLMAEPYLENDERVPMWKTNFTEACDELDAVREREEYAASYRPVRLPVVFG